MMAGHSKWANIKHRKGAQDAKRGKIFTKVAKEIIIAAKIGGSDPDMNARLRLAIQKAKGVNMPNDNIKRAIARATGDGEGGNLEEVRYEAYAYVGIAVVVDCLTDNKNRTLPEVKSVFTKAGCSLAEKGSVSYLFSQKGLFVFDNSVTEDQIMDVALEFDVDDIKENSDDSINVICDVSDYEFLRESFDKQGLQYKNADLTMIPSTTIAIDDLEIAKKMVTLMEKIEDIDDVQAVFNNADISDEIFENLDE